MTPEALDDLRILRARTANAEREAHEALDLWLYDDPGEGPGAAPSWGDLLSKVRRARDLRIATRGAERAAVEGSRR